MVSQSTWCDFFFQSYFCFAKNSLKPSRVPTAMKWSKFIPRERAQELCCSQAQNKAGFSRFCEFVKEAFTNDLSLRRGL